MLEKIVARSQAIRDPTFQHADMIADKFFRDREALAQAYPYIWEEFLHSDLVLNELLAPERRRQYGEMRKAIDRVCQVIDRERKRATRQEQTRQENRNGSRSGPTG